MSVLGQNTLSIRKKDVKEQKSIGVGFKKIMFAHKATLGDTGINLTALVAPSEMASAGFVNPNSSELTDANLLFYRKNLTIISSVKGPLVDFLSYTVPSSSRIAFNGFTAEDGEIFVGVIDPSAKTELRAVDAAALVSTDTLAVGVTDYVVGEPFEVNKYPLTQVGAVIVFRNGVQQFRNTGNTATPDGNYYEVNAGGGLGTVIRFNDAPSGIPDNILVVSNGLLVERPDGSMMAAIENIAGQLDQVIPTVAALSGQPTTNFQAAPNNVDLKAFGDQVQDHEGRIDALESPPDVELWLSGGSGYAATDTRIRRYTSVSKNTLSGYATYADSAANGTIITITKAGLYQFWRLDRNTGAVAEQGISLNATALTTAINTLTYAQGRRQWTQTAASIPSGVIATLRLVPGDIIRPHDGANLANETDAQAVQFQMIRLGE